MRSFLIFAAITGISFPIVACSTKNQAFLEPVVVETLISATQSWNGDSYEYPGGQAQMSLQRIIAQPGFRTDLHSHPQPGIAYVVRGTLFCRTSDGQSLNIGAGDSFATPQGSIHYCENNGKEEALVFVASAGAKGKETTIPSK